MNARRTREHRSRRIFSFGFGSSVAIHVVVFGVSAFRVTVPSGSEGPIRANPVPSPLRALEVVALSDPTKPAEVFDAAVMAAQGQPASALREGSPGAAARASSASPPTAPPPRMDAQARIALSMRPNFAVQRQISSWAFQPVPALPTPDARTHGHSAGEDEEGTGFWERLGISFGKGGGHCPMRPRPGTLVSGPENR